LNLIIRGGTTKSTIEPLLHSFRNLLTEVNTPKAGCESMLYIVGKTTSLWRAPQAAV
jgi:hypothetical protein